MWLKSKSIQKLGGGWLEQSGIGLWSTVQIMGLKARKDPEAVKLISAIRRDRKTLLSAFELSNLHGLVRAQATQPGAFAEVGVYRGGSAKLICHVKGDKMFHLFDTFEGLPQPTEPDRAVHLKGQYAHSLELVQEYLEGFPNLHFHRGVFPESAQDVEETTYSFVHFDVDLYDGTLACFEYFYPRMNPGGVMLCHDFDILAGVEKAVREFFEDKPESVFELATTQCLVVKR